MPPETKTSVHLTETQLELNKMYEFLQRLKTGGWKIPPYPDPVIRQLKELNKALQAGGK